MVVGSKAFFSSYDDFNPKDIDYLELVDKGDVFSNFMQVLSVIIYNFILIIYLV